MTLNKKQFNIWLSYLYAEKYKQGFGSLEDQQKRYCCLGVGCVVLIPKEKQWLLNMNRLGGGMPIHQDYAPLWLKRINDDFIAKAVVGLSTLNDDGIEKLGRFTHPEIAMLLQLVYIHKMLD